jgi:hypothetical protein
MYTMQYMMAWRVGEWETETLQEGKVVLSL